ncbi:hypothetical protein ACFVRU_01400 [Streptomyces sp. NPDC057927]
MTLDEHARAIEAAIKAAADEGFHLDDGNRNPLHKVELNQLDDYNDPIAWVELVLPDNPI